MVAPTPVKVTLPPINIPVIDRSTGLMTTQWYRWYESIQNRTGGSADNVSNAYTYADAGDVTTLTQAENFATAADAAVLTTAEAFATAGDVTTLAAAEAYTDAAVGGLTLTLPDGQILIGNVSNVATAHAVSGDGTLSDTGVLTVTKSGGVAFGSAAFASTGAFDPVGAAATALATAEAYSDAGDATTLASAHTFSANGANLTAGTVPNSALANSSITLNTHSVSLGGSLVLTATDIFADWSVSGHAITQAAVGSAASYTIQGEGSTIFIASRYSTNANGAQFSARKARGTISSPSAVVTSDFVFQMIGSGYGATGFQLCTNISGTVIEPTPSDTAMGGRLTFNVTPIGSITPVDVMHLDPGTGVAVLGNTTIDQNRTIIPGSTTVVGLPAIVAAGLRNVSNLEGGQGTVFGGNTLWRNQQNGQVAISTVTGAGVLSKIIGYLNFAQRAIVNNTMQKLSDVGLLAKLPAFGFPAGIANATDALLNWATPGSNPLINAGGLAWTATTGITGDGAHALTMANSLATLGATQNAVSAGVYVLAASAAAGAVIGMSNATTRRLYMQSRSSGAIVTRLNDQTDDSFTPAAYTGLFVMSRSLSTGYNDSRNDDAATAFVRASVVQNATPAFLGTLDSTGNEFCTASIGFWFIANTGLTPTDIANLRWIVRDYYLVQMGAIAADYTVATLPLPTTPPKGTHVNITDGAAVPVWAAAPTGGGSLYLPVITDSVAWHYG